jgi:hypothetical protein
MIKSQTVRARLNATDPVAGKKYGLGDLIAQQKGVLTAVYDFAALGGAVGDILLIDDAGNPAVLPDDAVVVRSYVEAITALDSAGDTATAALKLQAAGDILAATAQADLGAGVFVEGLQDGYAGTFLKLTAERQLKLTVGTEALTAGKLRVYLEWVQGG